MRPPSPAPQCLCKPLPSPANQPALPPPLSASPGSPAPPPADQAPPCSVSPGTHSRPARALLIAQLGGTRAPSERHVDPAPPHPFSKGAGTVTRTSVSSWVDPKALRWMLGRVTAVDKDGDPHPAREALQPPIPLWVTLMTHGHRMVARNPAAKEPQGLHTSAEEGSHTPSAEGADSTPFIHSTLSQAQGRCPDPAAKDADTRPDSPSHSSFTPGLQGSGP